MKDLMAPPNDIKSNRKSLLRKSGRVHASTYQVQNRHQHHPIERHSLILLVPAMQHHTMRREEDACQTKSRIHRRPICPKLRSAKPRRACKYHASDRNSGHQSPVEPLQSRVTVEAIVDRRYRCPPHQQDNTQVIKLVAKRRIAGTMIPDDVAYRGEQEASSYIDEVDTEGYVVLELCVCGAGICCLSEVEWQRVE